MSANDPVASSSRPSSLIIPDHAKCVPEIVVALSADAIRKLIRESPSNRDPLEPVLNPCTPSRRLRDRILPAKQVQTSPEDPTEEALYHLPTDQLKDAFAALATQTQPSSEDRE